MAALAAALLLYLWLRPHPLTVDTAAVSRGPLAVTVDEEGVTRVRERFTVAAPVAGRLRRIALTEGDPVAAGEVVARLEPVPLDVSSTEVARARLQAAEAQRMEAVARAEQARGTLEQTRRETARIQVLAAAGAESPQRREQAELAARNAERDFAAASGRVLAATSEVDAARAGLAGSIPAAGAPAAAILVRAPSAGRVLRVHEASERVVPVGAPLLDLGDAHALEIVVGVLSSDAVRIRSGDRVLVEGWGGATPLEGFVRRVEPSAYTRVSALGVEEQRVDVIASLPAAPPSLGDGFRVQAHVVVWSEPSVLRVPVSALFPRRAGWAVFAVEGARARIRPVQLGERGADQAQLLGGLREGERVVVYPPDQLRDGARVRPR